MIQIPYVDLIGQHQPIKEEIMSAISSVMDHGQFILGPEVAQFEDRFSKICGVQYAIGVNSGTDALVLALRVLDIGAGDEVITVANSFLASVSCITLVGATPVLIDVAADYNMDWRLIEQAITNRTKAILPVHLTGRPAMMDQIVEIARKHNLFVIEDCAQAVGATYNGQPVGSFGDIGCFSLHPLKTLNACGDGGVLTTNNLQIKERLELFRNHGLESRNNCVIWGYNSRLDSIQAAILLIKLKYLEDWTEKRIANSRFYQNALDDISNIKLPFDRPNERAVYHTFVILAEQRDDLQSHLANDGIGSAVTYPIPIHLQIAASGLRYVKGSFPITEDQAGGMLNLPVYGELVEEQLTRIVNSIRSFYGASQ